MISDNGPQFSSRVFSKFAKTYGFMHITSIPNFPQANGEAERAVKTIKHLLEKAEDPYLAMLAYRSTPLQNGYSPSELLMNSIPNPRTLQKAEKKKKSRMKSDHDPRHHAKDLTPLIINPYVVYKAETLDASWTVGGPEGARYTVSSSGWLETAHFTSGF